MTVIQGVFTSTGWSSDELHAAHFSQKVVRMAPSGSPLLAFSDKLFKSGERAEQTKVEWATEPDYMVQLTVNGAISDTAATTIVVDSTDPSSMATVTGYFGTAGNLRPNDVLMVVHPTTEPGTFSEEQLLVTSVSSDTTFTVQRGFAGTTAATIADNSILMLIGTAYPEGTTFPDNRNFNFITDYNYTQIFKESWEITNTALAIAKNRGQFKYPVNDVKTQMDRAFQRYRRSIEHAMLFGRRSTAVVANTSRRTMDGVMAKIPAANYHVYAENANPTLSDLWDRISPLTKYSINGSMNNERLALIGRSAKLYLNKLIANQNNVRLNYNEEIGKHGIDVSTLMSPVGNLTLMEHPLLTNHSRFTNSIILLDPTSIELNWLRPTEKDVNATPAGFDGKKVGIVGEMTMRVLGGGFTNGYIGNFVG